MTLSPQNAGIKGELEVPAALAAGGALAAAYALLAPSPFHGDAVSFASALHRGDLGGAYHPLYLPLARGIGIATGLSHEHALLALSAVSGGAAVALSYLAARRLGLPLLPAAFGAALLALAPALAFFASRIEVHAPHAAFVALALLAAARPPRSPVLAAAIAATTLGAVALSHLSGALSIPAIAWIGAKRASGSVRRLYALAAVVGLLAWIAAAVVLLAVAPDFRGGDSHETWLHRAAGLLLPTARRDYGFATLARYLGENLFAASGLLAALGILGLFPRGRPATFPTAPLVAWILPYAAAFSAWGVAERGAYFLPLYPAFAALAARGASRIRPGLALGGFAFAGLAAQAFLGVREARAVTGQVAPFRWVEDLRRATGDGGLFVTAGDAHPHLAHWYTSLEILDVSRLPVEDPVLAEAAVRAFPDLLSARFADPDARVFLDGNLAALGVANEPIARALEALGTRFDQHPVRVGLFEGWRLRPR